MELHAERAHPARIYDWYLGGKDNYEADRDAGRLVERAFPTVKLTARANRDFMCRATRWLAAQAGVEQFLDIGTGIPTEPNLHTVAQEVNPRARVMYVDNDPIVLAYARALMAGTEEGRTAYLHADARDPEEILASPELAETLDLSRPVALSLIGVLHFLVDDVQAHRTVSTLLDAFVPGSFLVATHLTADFAERAVREGVRVYLDRGVDICARDRDAFAHFFHGLRLVEPGLTLPHRWRPDDEPPESMDPQISFWAGVGEKTTAA